MKNTKNIPVQKESSKQTHYAHPTHKAVATEKPVSEQRAEQHKLTRRYSFDDNGGGYLGL